jgi:hypothetical protein
VRILGRDVAWWVALVAAVVQGVSAFFFPLSTDEQGVINAVAVAIAGLLTAIAVKSDNLLPLIVGLGKAVLALGVSFGLGWTPSQQSTLMVIVTLVAAAFVRTQVTAPVNAAGQLVAQQNLRQG